MASSRRYAEDDETPRTTKSPVKMIVVLIVVLVLGVLSALTFDITTVHGNELAVTEDWNKGVLDEISHPGTYFVGPGQKKVVYDVSSRVFVMNNLPDHQEKSEGRRQDAYKVQSAEGQDMVISMNLRWRIDPAKLVSIHKTVRQDIEEKLIRPVMMRITKDAATKRRAIDAYSGEGLVQLQAEIQNQLAADAGELHERGVIVENFVVENIELDPAYITEIKQKQVATQRTLRAAEEQKAAEAEALVAKAKAQADLNKAIVEAQRDKEVKVLAAEADNEKVILAAKAEAQKLVLEANGNKEAAIAKAEGILAMGKAEAEAKKLNLQAFAVEGSDLYATVEVSKSMSTAFQNISGYLPSGMNINMLSTGFTDAVNSFMGKLSGKPGPFVPSGTNAVPAAK